MTTIRLDIGVNVTAPTYNNFGDPTVGVKSVDMLDILGANTGVGLEILDAFSSTNTVASAGVDVFPPEVLSSIFFFNSSRSVKITGLPPSTVVKVKGIGFNVSQASRDTLWTVDGQSQVYDAGGGFNCLPPVYFTTTESDVNGDLIITVDKVASFGYMAAMELEYSVSSGVTVTATLGAIDYTSQDATISLGGSTDVNATLGAISYSSQDASISLTGSLDVVATLGSINYSSQNTTVSVTGDVDVIATLGAINYTSNNATISLASETIINATLGTIDYTSQDAAVTLSGLIDITSTLGAIVYNSYPVIVSIGEGQVVGNVTTSFADNIYTAGFKPDTITVSFK